MDFSTHPFSLCIEEERCDLVMQLFGFDPVVVSKFESVGDLLSVFLNRRYYPDLVSLEQIRKLGTRFGAAYAGVSVVWYPFAEGFLWFGRPLLAWLQSP